MAKVYIPNKGPYDFSQAEKFGELVFCTEGSVDKFDIAQMYRLLEQSLCHSQPGDFILVTSLTSICSIAAAIFAERHHHLNLLIFRGGSYISWKLKVDSQDTASANV